MTFTELLTENGTCDDIIDLLAERSEESDYWEKCYNFFLDKRDEELEDMSPRQCEWASKICENMADYREKVK